MRHTFKLNIHCENSAFCNDDSDPDCNTAGPEIARILREIASQIESGRRFDSYQTIRDINGNDVGRYALKLEEV